MLHFCGMGRRFDTLDGLRGIAALAVVVRHGPGLFGGNPLPTSYLAVDFFFLLSGFVLAHAYEKRFAAGLAAGSFIWQRLLRLYPLYGLGGTIMLVFLLAGAGAWNGPDLAVAAAFNLAFLPSPIADRPFFALNPPGWSLFFELAINLMWVLTFRWLSTRVLVAVVAVAAAALVGSAVAYGSLDTGWEWATFAGGFARVAFSFPAGVLIYRLMRNAPAWRVHPVIPTVALVLAFVPEPGWYDVAAVLFAFPAILIIGARSEAPSLRPVLSFLGLISYPLYALHFPVLMIAASVMARVPILPAPWPGLVVLAALVIGSALVAKFYDDPLRRMVGQRKPRPSSAT